MWTRWIRFPSVRTQSCGIAVEEHVAHVEVGLDPGRGELVHVAGHLERGEEELVPDLLHPDHDLQLLREREDPLLDDLLRARPGVLVGGLGVDDGGHQQHAVRSPELRVAQRRLHAGDALRHDLGVRARERVLPVVGVHHGVDHEAGLRGRLLDLGRHGGIGDRPDLDALEADVLRQLEALAGSRAPSGAWRCRRPSSCRPRPPPSAAAARPRRRARWPIPGTRACRSSSCRPPSSRGDYSRRPIGLKVPFALASVEATGLESVRPRFDGRTPAGDGRA